MSYHDRYIQEGRYENFWRPIFNQRLERLQRLCHMEAQDFRDHATKAKFYIPPFDFFEFHLRWLSIYPTLKDKCKSLERSINSMLEIKEQ